MASNNNCPFCEAKVSVTAKKCKTCGEWLVENPNQSSGTTIIDFFANQYEILEEIGRGGMAVVYKARQKSLDRIVALKIIPKEFTHDKEFVNRFKKEARDGALLNHRNIITIHDSGEIGGYPYMAMEYLEGKSLNQVLREKENAFTEDQIKEIIIPLLNGLEHTHSKGIIHRDIKSSNIMFDGSGRPVLMDFGIAKSTDATQLTTIGTYLGTPEYSSPEQADTQKIVDHQTDIYSLGIVAYEMATGKVPFKGDNPLAILNDVINKQPIYIRDINPKISAGFTNAIMRSLLKDKNKRYLSCTDFIAGITDGESKRITDDKLTQKAKNIKTKRTKKQRSSKIIYSLSIIILVGIIAISSYYYFSGEINQLKQTIIDLVNNETAYSKDSTVNSYMTSALEFHKQGKIIEPKGENAIEFAKTILDLESNNKYAIKLLNQIAKDFEEEGDRYIDDKEHLNARMKYNNSLKAKNDTLVTNKLKLLNENIAAINKRNKKKKQQEPDTNKGDNVAWELAKGKQTILAIENYLNQYPNGKYKNQALLLVQKIRNQHLSSNAIGISQDSLEWEKAKIKNTIAAYEAFLIKYPNSKFLSYANDIIQKIKLPDQLEKLGIDMIFVEGGAFQMGNNSGESDEKPEHTVTVANFYIGMFEITQRQWNIIMGINPSLFKGETLPVENISWDNTQAFIKKLNQLTGIEYRLPTEAEWEYSARGGRLTKNYEYPGSDTLDKVAWFWNNSKRSTHPVGTQQANEIGVCDASGNVWEWCSDWYIESYYKQATMNDPKGPINAKNRVIRGGSWNNAPIDCRNTNREKMNPNSSNYRLGFRLASTNYLNIDED